MNYFSSKKYEEQALCVAKTLKLRDCTILVTGATGMIGSTIVDILYLSNKYLACNIHIIALGRNSEKLRERFGYAAPEEIKLYVQDVVKPLELTEEIDYIVHAASNADPVSYSLFPVETLLTNVYGTNNFLEYCKKHTKTRMLMTSSFEAYGKKTEGELYSECDSGEIDLNQIRSCYPESKRCAEILMRCYRKEYGTDILICRLGSIYGPTMSINDSKAHAQFIRNGLRGEKIILKSKGLQRRTYCYVMDAVDAILMLLSDGTSGDAYNVAFEKSIASIADVANCVAKICGTEVQYDIPNEIEIAGFSRPQDCILDNHKLRETGWQGSYDLENGLKDTISILRETIYKNPV